MLIDEIRKRANPVAQALNAIAHAAVARPATPQAQAPESLAVNARAAAPRDDPSAEARFQTGQATLRSFGAEAQHNNMMLFAGRGDKPTPAKPADPKSPGVAVNGTSYKVGPYQKPRIHHDNGFLQNPNDPSDPKPIPTRPPTQQERDYYNRQVLEARGGNAASKIPFTDKLDSRLGLDNALPAYLHFLTGKGEDRTFDYGAYLKDDPAGQRTRDKSIADICTAADRLYGGLDHKIGQKPGDSVTFEVQGKPGSAAYPETEDWQKAIGGHTQWSSAKVTVTRQQGGSLKATADVTLRAEDRYNFNPGQADIKTGAKDSERGVLEQSGLAQQYTQTGEAKYSTSWTIGKPGAASPVKEGHGGR